MSLRDLILKAEDRPLHKVPVAPWQCDVWLRTWSAAERFEVESWAGKGVETLMKTPHWRERIVALSTLDEQGNKVFTDADMDALSTKNADVLHFLVEEILKHNGLNPEHVDEAKQSFTTGQS